MKIKSLLVAGLAVVAFNAMADDVTFTHNSKLEFPADFTISAGEVKEVILTATFDDSAYESEYTGITSGNFYLDLPAGLSVTYEEFVSYDDYEDGVWALNARGKKFNPFGDPMTNTVDNQYRFVWADGTQTAMTVNPVKLAFLELTAADDFAGGDIKLAVFNYMKPVDNADNIKGVLPEDRVGETLITLGGGDVAVENINAGKAVAGVKYYNVAGQAADSAFEGVNIVVTTYADGTQNVVKVVK